MLYTIYEDSSGTLFRVTSGISDGNVWMTVRIPVRSHGSTHRVKSPRLPLRDTREEAQADLDSYAAEKKFRRIGTVGMGHE